MLIRPAHPSEADTLTHLALRSKAFWGYDDAFLEACREELTLTPTLLRETHVYVALRDAEIAGFYQLRDSLPLRCELEMLFVAPEQMRQGVGRSLLRHACGVARTQGANLLSIQSDPQAADFYEAIGALRIGTSPSGSIPGRHLPVYELSLKEDAL